VGKSYLASMLGCAAVLALFPGVSRATNPCDVDEKACAEWNKALAEMQSRVSQPAPSGDASYQARACDADPAYCNAQGLVKDNQLPKTMGAGMNEAAQAAQAQAPADCPDGTVLNGRDMEITLKWDKTGKSSVLKMPYSTCLHEFPRGDEEPPMQPWTRRVYKSQDGSTLGVYSSPDRTTSTISLWLSDDSDAASLIPAFETAKLAAGEPIDLGEVLLVRADNGAGESVLSSHLSIRAVAAAAK
jgi:hypothetical protein